MEHKKALMAFAFIAGCAGNSPTQTSAPVPDIHPQQPDPAEELSESPTEDVEEAAVGFVIQGIKDEGGLARAGDPGDDGEAVPKVDVDLLEIVLGSAPDLNGHDSSTDSETLPVFLAYSARQKAMPTGE